MRPTFIKQDTTTRMVTLSPNETLTGNGVIITNTGNIDVLAEVDGFNYTLTRKEARDVQA